LEYEFWGVGPWALAIVDDSGKRTALLNRLPRLDAFRAGDALRKAGYRVDGLEPLAGQSERGEAS
jgi:hypothetical protein